MNIVYLHGAPVPSRAASTVQVMKMCDAFAALGHRVTLFAPRASAAEAAGGDVHARYGVRSGFAFESMIFPARFPWGLAMALQMAWQARRLRPDVVYARHAVAAYACAIARLTVIFEAHRPAAHLKRSERWALRRLVQHPRLRTLVAISGALRAQFANDWPGPRAPMLVAHDGADPARAAPAEHASRAGAGMQVGYIGNLFPGRGVDLVIDLARRCPEAVFHIVGGADADLAYWRPRAALQNLHLHGYLPHPEAQKMLQDFDVVLAPYGERVAVHGDPSADISAYFSPLKLFEYMAAGKPIVCSDVAVLQEVVEPERTALVCRRDDAEDWACALRRLAAEPELRRRLGAAAREEFTRRYTWEARARHVLQDPATHQDAHGTP